MKVALFPFMSFEAKHLKAAIALAVDSVKNKDGGPFGAVIVKDGKVIGTGHNTVTSQNDPTAHAEINAIRAACKALGSNELIGCEIYTSCQPCPMCLGAIYWARPKHVYYACNKDDAARIGFDDSFIYEELELPEHLRKISASQHLAEEGKLPFDAWEQKTDKKEY